MSSVPSLNPILYGVPSTCSNKDWEPVGEFLEKNPILYDVPRDKLIIVKPHKPYMVTEKGKIFLWSAALIPFLSHREGLSTAGLFQDKSLAVFRPLGVLGVRDFKNVAQPVSLDKDMIRSNYGELRGYLISLLRMHHGDNILKLLLNDLNMWLNSMRAPTIDEEMIAFPAALLPREERGVLGMDIHTLVRKKMPLMGENSKAMATDIIASIPEHNGLMLWPATADKNPFLHLWRTHKFTENTHSQQGNNNCPALEGKPNQRNSAPRQQKKSEEILNNSSSNDAQNLQGQQVTNKNSRNKRKKRRMNNSYSSSDNSQTGNRNYSSSSDNNQTGNSNYSSSSDNNQTGNSNYSRKKNGMRKQRKKHGRQQNRSDKKQRKFLFFVGASLMDHHRNSYAHVFEAKLMQAIQEFDEEQRASLMEKNYKVSDVIDLLHYEYPDFLPRTLLAIKYHAIKYESPDLWREINIRGRFKLPMSLNRCSDDGDCKCPR